MGAFRKDHGKFHAVFIFQTKSIVISNNSQSTPWNSRFLKKPTKLDVRLSFVLSDFPCDRWGFDSVERFLHGQTQNVWGIPLTRLNRGRWAWHGVCCWKRGVRSPNRFVWLQSISARLVPRVKWGLRVFQAGLKLFHLRWRQWLPRQETKTRFQCFAINLKDWLWRLLWTCAKGYEHLLPL